MSRLVHLDDVPVTAKRLKGSTTLFDVRGQSFSCKTPGCDWVAEKGTIRADARICGGCGGRLEPIHYQVDTAAYAPIGGCDCAAFCLSKVKEFGMTRRRKCEQLGQVGRITLPTTEREKLRCKHIKEARQRQLDEAIMNHERERLHGRRENPGA